MHKNLAFYDEKDIHACLVTLGNNSFNCRCTVIKIDGEKMETVANVIFLGSKITADSDCSHKIKRCLFLGRKAMTNLRKVTTKVVTVYEKQRHHFANKGPYSQSYGFSSSHVQIRELDYKES